MIDEVPRLRDRLGPAQIPVDVEARLVRGALARVQLATRPGRRWELAALALGAAAGAVAVALILRPQSQATAPLAPLAPRSVPAVEPPAAPLTGPRSEDLGRHRMTLAQGARAVRLPGGPGAVTVRLDRGQAQFAVAHLERVETFHVVADPVVIAVIGTRFRVTREADCSAVAVEEGEVEVAYHGKPVARLHPSDERTFCLSAAGLESSSPGEAWVRGALALIATGHDLPRAAALLERYRRSFPRGLLVEECLFHLIRLRVRLGQAAEARELLHELEATHPDDDQLTALRALVRGR